MFLKIKNISKKFGGLTALENVSLDIDKGELVGLIGPNGSGKTTLLNCISGIYRVDEGSIHYKDELISNLKPHQIVQKGISRNFQVSRIFKKLSVLQNMLLTVYHMKRGSDPKTKALNLLEFVGILHLKDDLAGTLSGGQKKLLEFARMLMADPELFLLDEPFAGVHPLLKKELTDHVKDLNKEEKTFIIVSHDIPTTLGLCEKAIALDEGKIISVGSPEEIRNDPKVIEAYLGA